MSFRHLRGLRRLGVVTALAVTAIAATTLPASAHVRVSSPDAAPGGFGKLVFRVPTESASASTTKLTVSLPRDTPFAFVSSRPVPGWSISTTQRRLGKPLKAEGFTLTKVVSTVTWSARPGAGIKPGQFDEFELSVGPFPRSAMALELPATQVYSDGSIVKWDQPSKAGQPEPEHPAPTLDLSAATTRAASPTASSASPGTPKQPTGSDTDDPSRWLSGSALLLALLALGVTLSRGRGRARAA